MSAAIDAVCANIHAPDNIAFNVENGSQIGLNLYSMDCLTVKCRQFVDLVWAQPGIERILLEDLKAAEADRRCSGVNFARARRKDFAARNRYFIPGDQALAKPRRAR